MVLRPAYAVTWVVVDPAGGGRVPAFSSDHPRSVAVRAAGRRGGVTGTAFFATAVTDGPRRGPAAAATPGLLAGRGALVLQSRSCSSRWARSRSPSAVVSPDALRALTPSALAAHQARMRPISLRSAARGVRLARVRVAAHAAPVRLRCGPPCCRAAVERVALLPVRTGVVLAGGGANGVLGLGLFVVFTTGLTVVFTWLSEQHRREPAAGGSCCTARWTAPRPTFRCWPTAGSSWPMPRRSASSSVIADRRGADGAGAHPR